MSSEDDRLVPRDAPRSFRVPPSAIKLVHHTPPARLRVRPSDIQGDRLIEAIVIIVGGFAIVGLFTVGGWLLKLKDHIVAAW